MSAGPLVSIVIPVYNGADYLRDAIDSALAQTYPRVEVVVVNDGSTDGGATEAIAKSYGERIRYFWKPNGHVASALNYGISRMTGDYMSWLSHDDLYLPDKVEKQIRAAGRSGPRAVMYGDFETLDVASGEVRPVRLPNTPPERFRWFITISNSLHGCTLLVPKACFDECGLFDERLRTTQDYDLWFRIAARFRFVHLAEIGVRARLHPGQGTNQLRGIALQECDALLAGFVRQLDVAELTAATGERPSRAYATIAANMRSRGFENAAEEALACARRGMLGEPWPVRLHFRVVVLGRTSATGLGTRLRKLRARVAARARAVQGRLVAGIRSAQGVKGKFSRIYRRNEFGGVESRSGQGSSLEQTKTIRRELPRLAKKLGVRTLLDAPCGDFHWMQHVALDLDRYWGVDIVEAIIERNKVRFGDAQRQFLCRDLIRDTLPAADLVLCRDCLVHLSFQQAMQVLRNFKRSGCRFVLTTTFTDRTVNVDLVGDDVWRTLNLRLAPFNLPPPLELVNEACTEGEGAYADKSLGLWRLADLALPEAEAGAR